MPSSTQPILTLCTIAGEWTNMDKPGSNGFPSILAALNWGGVQIEVDGAQSDLWHAAVADVSWVIEQLIKARSRADNGDSK